MRLYEDKPIFGEDGYDIAALVLLNLIGFSIKVRNMAFILFGMVSIKRKYMQMRVLSAMLQPVASGPYFLGHELPSINMLDAQSIRAWLSLRASLLDLGCRFTNRVFLYTSAFIVLYGALGGILALNFFGVLNYKISAIVWTLGLFDIVVVSTILITQL